MQAKGSTARIIVPRDPEIVCEVAQQLSHSPSDDDLLSAEEYLLECGYIAPVVIGLTRASYSVTPAGLDWLGRSFLSPPGAPESVAEERERAEPRSSAGGSQEGAERSGTQEDSGFRTWWRRVFGG
jgi:hypothetical protein